MSAILLICGSTRAGSLNARLLAAIGGALGGPCATLPRAGLPLFDPEREHEPAIRAEIARLHGAVLAAPALVIATPEYNGQTTPYLKNLIDWLSRLPRLEAGAANAFLDKPVLLASATPGWSGGALAMQSLRALLAYVGAVAFGETIGLPYAERAFAKGPLPDPAFAGEQWAAAARRFARFAAATNGVAA